MSNEIDRPTRRQQSEVWLLLALVGAFRLGSLLLMRPGGFFADFSDFYYYRDYAALSDRGLYPYVNIWSPYPPLFPWLLVGIHRLALLLPPWEQPQFLFTLGLGSVLALAECGNTALVYAIAGGTAKHRRALRSAVFYALMFVPAYTSQAHYDSLPVFFLLLGLWLLLTRRWLHAGAATALGVMTKLLPGLLAPVALRMAWPDLPRPLHFRPPSGATRWVGERVHGQAIASAPTAPDVATTHTAPLPVPERTGALRYLLSLTVVVGAIVAPFLFANPRLLLAPFDIERIRPPWQTIWAVIDNYYGFGLAPADVRDLAALDGPAWSGRVPYWLLSLTFAATWAWLYVQPRDWRKRRTVIVFVPLSLTLLFFFSKGWSPQYLTWLIPFLAILWPSWRGAAFALMLAFLNYLESHVFFMLLPREHWILVFTTATRAAALAMLALTLAGDYLGRPPLPIAWRRLLRWTAALALALLLPLLGWRLTSDYAADRHAQEPARAAIEYVSETADPAASVFFVRQADLERFYPALHDGLRLRTLDDRAADGDLDRHLALQLASGSPDDLWLVEPEDEAADLGVSARQTLGNMAYAAQETTVGGYRLSRWLPLWSLTRPAEAPVFGGQVELLAWRLDSTAASGGSVSLVLVWRLRQELTDPLSAFVHLSADDGPPLAQSDGPPAWPWPAGETIVDRRRIDGTGLAPGAYAVQVGLYDPSGGARLPLTTGADSLVLGEVLVTAP